MADTSESDAVGDPLPAPAPPIDVDPLPNGPVVILDPVIPDDPPPMAPGIPDGALGLVVEEPPAEDGAAPLIPPDRFHKITLYRTQTAVSFGAGFPAEILTIPVVERSDMDDTTLRPVTGLRTLEFQSEDLVGAGPDAYHTGLLVTVLDPTTGGGFSIYRYFTRLFTRSPHDVADSPRALPSSIFEPGVRNIQVRVNHPSGGVSVKTFRWRKFKNGQAPYLNGPNLFYQVNP